MHAPCLPQAKAETATEKATQKVSEAAESVKKGAQNAYNKAKDAVGAVSPFMRAQSLADCCCQYGDCRA